MPAKYTLHVAVTAPLLEFVEDQVSTGQYATVSSVVRAGLELLLQRSGTSAADDGMPRPSEPVRHA